MKILKSSRMALPLVYFITDREEVKDLPIGVPFMFGDKRREKALVRILEYEVLYQKAIKSGFPFNFREILKDAGYIDLIDWRASTNVYMEVTSAKIIEDIDHEINYKTLLEQKSMLEDYSKDSSAIVDIQKLKDLDVFPIWLNNIEEAVRTNIHNFATFNSSMYNKKLDGMYGGVELVSPPKNLIIIDISSSIPRAVSSTCLTLAKYLTESFYADLIITGSESKFYSHEEIKDLNVEKAYDCGMGNECKQIRSIITSDDRHYKTVICFGDNDNIGTAWGNASSISDEDGKKLCTWTVDKLINFHTGNCKGAWRYSEDTDYVAGYARWFTPIETEHIRHWVKYLN